MAKKNGKKRGVKFLQKIGFLPRPATGPGGSKEYMDRYEEEQKVTEEESKKREKRLRGKKF